VSWQSKPQSREISLSNQPHQMVKREKSPEINEDIILFVVWIPYPLNPNWVYEQDVQDCAKWVAEVIGNEYYLISIHQKPSVCFFSSSSSCFMIYVLLFQSRGMILLEISKEFTDHGRLLGQHQWFHFLKDPTKDEEGHKSCVYYSVYRTCREARKDGKKSKIRIAIPIPQPLNRLESYPDIYKMVQRLVTRNRVSTNPPPPPP